MSAKIIAYHRSGFEIHFQKDQVEELDKAITWLEKHGYRPTRDIQYTPDGLPICPRHSVVMSKREKQGDTWYSHKLTDEATGQTTYCRGYGQPGPAVEEVEQGQQRPAAPAAPNAPKPGPRPAHAGNWQRPGPKPSPSETAEASPAHPAPAASKPNGKAQARTVANVNDDLFN